MSSGVGMMSRKPVGWHNESARHSLAARGVKTNYSVKKGHFRKHYTIPGLEYLDAHEAYAWYMNISDIFHRMGYEEPRDWYIGNGPELIIINRDMASDQKVVELLRKSGLDSGDV